MRYSIKNGRVIDPANDVDAVMDLVVADGRIEKIGAGINGRCDKTIDAKSMIVAPGLVDMHAHLREPGREDEETIRSGSRAAVRGGFTSVSCMPNTTPPIDRPEIVNIIKEAAKKNALCNIFITGAITADRAGKKLAQLEKMKKEGVLAVSDDGSSVDDPGLMLAALQDCKKNNMLLIAHCEDLNLSAGGVMNKGFISTKMGLRGAPRSAEYERIKRDLELAKKADARIHIAHVSCEESVKLIEAAKQKGVKVTAETAPHYFSLTEDCCVTYDTNTKMNPPLRTKDDVLAIKEGLARGTIDVIATDHAPHTDAEKGVEFDFAPFGITGFETALSLAAAELVDTKILSWGELIRKMSVNPSAILGIDRGSLKKGASADIVIIDPEKSWIYKKDLIESKSRNSPFIDWKLKTRPVCVFVAGRVVMQDEKMMG